MRAGYSEYVDFGIVYRFLNNTVINGESDVYLMAVSSCCGSTSDE